VASPADVVYPASRQSLCLLCRSLISTEPRTCAGRNPRLPSTRSPVEGNHDASRGLKGSTYEDRGHHLLLRSSRLGAVRRRGLLQTARAARAVLLSGTHPMVDNDDGTITFTTSDSGLFAGEEAALRAQATPRLAIAALVFGIVVGFAGNLLSL